MKIVVIGRQFFLNLPITATNKPIVAIVLRSPEQARHGQDKSQTTTRTTVFQAGQTSPTPLRGTVRLTVIQSANLAGPAAAAGGRL